MLQPASPAWTPKDWIAVYAAVVSTVVFAWNCYTWTRGNRPHLVAFFSIGSHQIVSTKGPLILGRTETHQGGSVVVHNRGGAPTALLEASLVTRARWCPAALLPVVGRWAITASDSSIGQPEVQRSIAPGEDGSPMHALLAEAEMRALKEGRLLVLVKHSWNRERPDRVRVFNSIAARSSRR